MPRGLALVFIALFASTAFAADPRPSKKAWQDKQDAAADDKAAAAAKEAKMAAVNKVVELLSTLQTKVLKEGEEEAASYNKFACFCKDTTADKTAAINKGKNKKSSLTTDINDLASKRDTLDGEIERLLGEIKAAEGEVTKSKEERAAELKVYETNAADLSGAIYALEGAIKVVKASKPSLAQLQSVAQTTRTAALLADTLGLAGSEAMKQTIAFLQQPANEVEMENYKFKSSGIIDTLEGLLKDFTDEKNTIDQEEAKAIAVYESYQQEKTALIKALNKELADDKKARSVKIEEIAEASEELTTVAATLLDDQEYLTQTAQMCSDTAKTWDQRSQMRADELSTLTEVMGIMKGTVTEKTSARNTRLAQRGVSVRLAEVVATDEASMEAVEADAEAADAQDASSSFLQTKARTLLSTRRQQKNSPQAFISALLKNKGLKLRSTLLTALAVRIAADPFAKIKQLIQELIERLLQEAADEANQKGWCDKAQADAKQKRDNAAEEVELLNGQMARAEATRDTLALELQELADDMKELKDKQKEATDLRKETADEAKITIAEAEAGRDAVAGAIDTLDKFYKTRAKNKVDLSLDQQSPADDAPGAGFKIGEAYTGAQGDAGGIIGMMEVMKGDFVRTISMTEKTEAEEIADYNAFMTETEMSYVKKDEASKAKTSQKKDTEDKLSADNDSLKEEMEILKTSIEELIQLKAKCIDTGMSYEERVARREDEIESLNQALCIFQNWNEYGVDGAADTLQATCSEGRP